MFIEQAYKPGNRFWKYLLGSVIIFAFAFLGNVPMALAIALKSMKTGKSMPQTQEDVYSYFDDNTTLLLILISFVVALAGVIIAVRSLHGQKIKEIITARPKVSWRRFFYSFALWGGITLVTTLIGYFSEPENFVIQFELVPFLILCCIAILLIPIQTSVEELVFRGYLIQGFGILAKNRWFPLLMTSLIFGLLHFGNPEVAQMGPVVLIYYILTGALLGILTLMDDGAELALGFHAANNLLAALLVTSDYSVLKTYAVLKDITEPTAGPDVILPALVIYPIVLFVYARKYKWTGWKEKLTGKIYPPATNSIDDISGY